MEHTSQNPFALDSLTSQISNCDIDEPPRGRTRYRYDEYPPDPPVSPYPPVAQINSVRCFPVLNEGEEIFSVSINPLVVKPDAVLDDIFAYLREVDITPFGRLSFSDYLFIKPANKALPFITPEWRKVCALLKRM